VEDTMFPVQCVEDSGCQLEAHCISHDAWLDVAKIIQSELQGRTLAEMLKKWQDKKSKLTTMPYVPKRVMGQECKGPRRDTNNLQSID
jgi:DNA-binding IscR family transcriptional regulator